MRLSSAIKSIGFMLCLIVLAIIPNMLARDSDQVIPMKNKTAEDILDHTVSISAFKESHNAIQAQHDVILIDENVLAKKAFIDQVFPKKNPYEFTLEQLKTNLKKTK